MSHSDNLPLCATYVKAQVCKTSGPDSPDIVWNLYVKTIKVTLDLPGGKISQNQSTLLYPAVPLPALLHSAKLCPALHEVIVLQLQHI